MKKQFLLTLFLVTSLIGLKAQEILSFANTSNQQEVDKQETKPSLTSDDEMSTILKQEIQLFTDFVINEFEYPEPAKVNCMEGQMIVRIVFDGEFKKAEIIKSIDPLFDEMVLNKISKYIEGFDRTYKDVPRLVFKVPINFSLED